MGFCHGKHLWFHVYTGCPINNDKEYLASTSLIPALSMIFTWDFQNRYFRKIIIILLDTVTITPAVIRTGCI